MVRVAQRGLTIKVIVDKSQEKAKHAQIKLLTDAGIDVKVDDKVSIAHNKVILIDGHTLLTGSYNFTEGAISSLFTIRPSPKNTEIIG